MTLMMTLLPPHKKNQSALPINTTLGRHTDGEVAATAEEAQSNSLNNNDNDGDVAATAEEVQSASPINSDTGRTY